RDAVQLRSHTAMHHVRRTMSAVALLAVAAVLLTPSAAVAATDGDFEFTVSGGAATITGYTGTSTDPVIPSTVSDPGGTYPVTVLGYDAFAGKPLSSVSMPDTVTAI